MFFRLFSACILALFLTATLSGCGGSLRRDDDAAKAKTRMIGMTREEILACMGPAKKKAAEGTTEVWSYLSTDYESSSTYDTIKPTGYAHSMGSHSKNFCTVNVTMKDGIVKSIHYLGPTATNFYNDNDQCGYAVAGCVERGAE
jgi:hypothetical protein